MISISSVDSVQMVAVGLKKGGIGYVDEGTKWKYFRIERRKKKKSKCCLVVANES